MPDSIEPFVHRKVAVLHQDATAYEAARAMCERAIGTVVVSDGRGFVRGLLTDRDLSCSLISYNQSPETALRELMRSPAITVGENATLGDVIALMKEHGVRRIPVVQYTRQGYERCVGMISLDDLIVAKMISREDLAEIVKLQIFGQKKSWPRWKAADLSAAESSEAFLTQLRSRTGLSDHVALSLMEIVAGLVIRRLHFADAAGLIARLPERLQSELLDLPAGPDASITAEVVLQELTSRFDIDQTRGRFLLRAMWTSLEEATTPAFCAEIADDLPDDLRRLFIELPAGSGQLQEIPEVDEERA